MIAISAVCVYIYKNSLILIRPLCLIKKNLTPLSATSTLLHSPSPSSPHSIFFFPPHTSLKTHSAYPSYRSMIIHTAMRLDQAGKACHGVMGVFPDDDLGVLQPLCQEQGIQT